MTVPAVASGGVAGLIIGSFVATLVVRWPRHRGLGGRSACDTCDRSLRWFELVPLLSWLVQRGRCRRCGGAIDPAHPLVETLCGGVGMAAMAVAWGAEGASGAVFGWLLVPLAILDLRYFWLPDRLIAALALAGLLASAYGLGPLVIDSELGGLAGLLSLAAIGSFYRILRGRQGLGGGDPKLLGAIGTWLGWQPLPFVLLGACAIGLLAVIALRLAGRHVNASTRMPLGTLLATSAFLAWLMIHR